MDEALVRTPQAVWLPILRADILLPVVGDDLAAEKHLREVLALAPNETQTRKRLVEILGERGSGKR